MALGTASIADGDPGPASNSNGVSGRIEFSDARRGCSCADPAGALLAPQDARADWPGCRGRMLGRIEAEIFRGAAEQGDDVRPSDRRNRLARGLAVPVLRQLAVPAARPAMREALDGLHHRCSAKQTPCFEQRADAGPGAGGCTARRAIRPAHSVVRIADSWVGDRIVDRDRGFIRIQCRLDARFDEGQRRRFPASRGRRARRDRPPAGGAFSSGCAGAIAARLGLGRDAVVAVQACGFLDQVDFEAQVVAMAGDAAGPGVANLVAGDDAQAREQLLDFCETECRDRATGSGARGAGAR